jgi:hypothetical protein
MPLSVFVRAFLALLQRSPRDICSPYSTAEARVPSAASVDTTKFVPCPNDRTTIPAAWPEKADATPTGRQPPILPGQISMHDVREFSESPSFDLRSSVEENDEFVRLTHPESWRPPGVLADGAGS